MFSFGRKKKIPASDGQKARQLSASSSRLKSSLLSLEQRLMFDAAASATASEVASEQVAQEQAHAAVSGEQSHEATDSKSAGSEDVVKALTTYMPTESRHEIAFVDPTVPDHQELLAGMDPHIEVVVLDGGKDGVQQMASALEGRTAIDAIHIISHGSEGALHLGTGTLNTETMSDKYAQNLATIQHALSDQADIVVYGCDFAKGDAGQMAVDTLAQLTGADVEASTDLTGSISFGGDWDFEVKTGSIETSIAVSYDVQMNWAEVLGQESVSDTFSAKSYANSDGTHSWSSNWSEVDVGSSGANGGHISVNSGQLRIDTVAGGESVSRGVDLSGAKNATLSFDYTNEMAKSGSVEVRVSTDGGAHYQTLGDGVFSKTSHTGSGRASFDLSGYMSANTKIQFLVAGSSGGDRLTIDNVQVDYNVPDVNHAPTDITLTGNTVAENAVKGTVVGTAAGSDADAGDKLTYSLKDTAGGRFAINATTGQITVADGSLLNYEANASHSITVQLTDSGGLTVDKTFTIGVSNVNEAPTDIGDKGDAKDQSGKGEVKGHSEKGDAKDQSDEGEVKDQRAKGEVKGHSEKGDAKDQSVKGDTKGQSDKSETKSQPDVKEASSAPVVSAPVVAAGLTPVVEPVASDPGVKMAAGSGPVMVSVGTEPVIDPVVEVAVDHGPIIVDPVGTEPVVEMTGEPDPIVVDPGVTEPVVEVAMDPVPVVEDAMDPAPLVEMTVGPTPAMELTVEPEPVVEITAGPGPVANPVVTEQLGVAPKVNVGNVKMSSPAAGQTLVASFHQQPSAGPDRTSPLSSSQSPLSDFGVGRSDAVNTAGKMVDGQSEPVVTLDTTAPSKTSSPIDQKWIAEETAVSGKGGTLFSASGSKVGAADNHDSRGPQDQAQFAFGQVPWPPAEEAEKAPEDSGDLAMPMLAGLVGAALQGNMRKKEKMTTMQGDIPAGEQQTANAPASQESSSDDDKEAPPRAA